MKTFKLNDQQWELLSTLRAAGCAVTVFLPHEMGDTAAEDIEESMCSAGWNEINISGNVGLVI